MPLSDIATAAFRAMTGIDGVQVTHKTATLKVIIEAPVTGERSFDAAPGPSWEYRLHAHREDFTTAPKVGDSLTSAQRRYRIAGIREIETDPIIELECTSSPL